MYKKTREWRATSTQVKPSLTDWQTISIFLSSLKKVDFDCMDGQVIVDFSTSNNDGFRIEGGLKSEKLINVEAL